MNAALRLPRIDVTRLMLVVLVALVPLAMLPLVRTLSGSPSLMLAKTAIMQATKGMNALGPTNVSRGPTADTFYATQHTANGFRQLVAIEDSSAPTTYSFAIPVPAGGRVQLTHNGLGPAHILSANGHRVATIAAPWAKAQNGPVATYYRWDPQRPSQLTQVVNHRTTISGQSSTYPVVADPSVSWFWNGFTVHLTRDDMAFIATSGTWALAALLAIPGVGLAAYTGLLVIVPYAGWAYYNDECPSIAVVLGTNAGVTWNRC